MDQGREGAGRPPKQWSGRTDCSAQYRIWVPDTGRRRVRSLGLIMEQTHPTRLMDSTALATIPSASSASSRPSSLASQRSPAQTSAAPLLRDTCHPEDSHPATSGIDPEFPQSAEDSWRRKGKRRSLFRRHERPQLNVSSSLTGPSRTSALNRKHDQHSRIWDSSRKEDDRSTGLSVGSLPVKIFVASHQESPISAQDSVQLATRQNPMMSPQALSRSSRDLIPIDVFADDGEERQRAERELSQMFQEEAAQMRDGKSRCRFCSCLSRTDPSGFQCYTRIKEGKSTPHAFRQQSPLTNVIRPNSIMFRGVPYFSSMTLFPFDPDAWSLAKSQSSFISANSTMLQPSAQRLPGSNASRRHIQHDHSESGPVLGGTSMALLDS